MEHEGTYSPEDNKLRLYPAHRLDADEYKAAREAGFRWAPRQELFVCPAWSPRAFDWLARMCGEVQDEATPAAERAAERAERFEVYEAKRAADAERAHDAVSAIADNIPLGQPILVGHHSEKRARKDAEKIERGMQRAVSMWETSKYWNDRAAGVLRHSEHMDSPAVRARRIKKLEAERRKWERTYTPKRNKAGEVIRFDQERSWIRSGGKSDDPREVVPHVLIGAPGHEWPHAEDTLPAAEKHGRRWVDHLTMRIEYETALLGEAGELERLEKPKRPKLAPILNYQIAEGETIAIKGAWSRDKPSQYEQRSMTKAEWKKATKYGGGGMRYAADKSHRVRTTSAHRCPGYVAEGKDGTARANHAHRSVTVFLTDSKAHPRPEPKAAPEPTLPDPPKPSPRPYVAPERTKFDDMRESLRAGVQTVSAPQLFETPDAVICRMMERAELKPGDSVLEPSAGTGRLVRAAFERTGHRVDCVEINHDLVAALKRRGYVVAWGDFLTFEPDQVGTFDRIVMNPPFKDAVDIKHIEHARQFLKPGGRLVALCAAGSRQRKALDPAEGGCADSWEMLPHGSFESSGTGVSVALVVIEG